MEIDFLGLGSKFSPIIVKEEATDSSKDSADVAPFVACNRGGMMDWSLSSKGGSATRFLSFKPSRQERRIYSANGHMNPSDDFTATSIPDVFDQNRRSQYNSVQEVRLFPTSSQQEEETTSFKNSRPLGGIPIMAPPVSVIPAPNTVVGTTDISSSSKFIDSPPAQMTIFYGGSVSVYQDVSPEKAQAIMLLAGNGLQTKPVSMPKATKPVYHSPATIDPSTMPCSFLPSISYTVSETGSASNGVLPSTLRNNQTTATNAQPSVGLPQSRKASLARFLEKRKDRVINVSPYYVENKSPIDCRARMSECVSSSLSSSSAVRPN